MYGNDGSVIGDTSQGNSTGIFFLGCEVRACSVREVARPPGLTRPARGRAPAVPRRPQHDTLRGVLQLTDAGNLPACLAGLTYASRCDVPPVRVRDGTHAQLHVDRDALLTLLFVNCGDERVSALGVDYVLLNPGGQNLPTAEAPLPVSGGGGGGGARAQQPQRPAAHGAMESGEEI